MTSEPMVPLKDEAAKQADVALRASEERFRALTDLSPQFVFTCQPNGSVLYCNQWGLDFLGRSLADIQGHGWIANIHPEHRLRVYQAWQTATQDVTEYNLEVLVCRADGVYRWLYFRAVPILDAAGQLDYWLGVALDISDRVQLERDRERLLQQEQAARAAAERANRAKDEFLAIVSHELRTPLNPILGWAQLLQTQQLDAAKTTYALSTIARNAKLQAELIDDLLDVSRILRGKLTLTVHPIDLGSIVRAAIETVHLAAEAKGICLNLEIRPDVASGKNPGTAAWCLQIMGDAARLQQIIWNLLTNAIKFTPPGGQVHLTLEPINLGTRPLHPADSAPPHPTHVQLTVTDTGKGIHPNFLPHVFDYFCQEDGATTRKFGGLGLGLAIVHHLVELHGGTVQAESQGDGQGATFIVQLPLIQPPHPATQAAGISRTSPQSWAEAPLAGKHILVVDDEADNRSFVAFLLQEAGATVISAANAGEALVALAQSHPDLLISDIGMPDIDGYSLIQQIRALPPQQGGTIPAIALTAYAAELDQQRAIAAGFQQHVAKPLEPEVLIRAVVALL
jgi:PAS domain S-box-containing protein